MILWLTRTVIPVRIFGVSALEVRRAKLYYARELRGKAARMKENYIRKVVHEVVDPKSKKAKDAKDADAPAEPKKEEAKPAEEAKTPPPAAEPAKEEAAASETKEEDKS